MINFDTKKMTNLQNLLKTFRQNSQTTREQGTYFEELVIQYFKNENLYKDLYEDVWTYSIWAKQEGLNSQDAGIDLVAKTRGTNEFHAIQCKFYDESYQIRKADIDSFFTASGKKNFTHRIIVSTTNHWSEHAEDALQNQQPPVTKIDLNDLENSQIDWSKYQPNQTPILKPKKQLRDHQKEALKAVSEKLEIADRGKLIMACGTGKTFTSLKIAEKVAGKNKRVLFLVPSLSLLSQTLSEWTQETQTLLHSFAVCSDSEIGKKRKKDEDIVQTFAHELRYPATTDSRRLASEIAKRHDESHMSVIFSTYHSIEVISKAQKEYGLPDFDLIICDEAHRTTGQTFDDQDESAFVRVHNQEFIRSAKRLYMTATPRIYGDIAKEVAKREDIDLFSMDDEVRYGKDLFVINFSEAVARDLLVDYKVLVLAVEEAHITRRLQNLLKDENNQLKVDDAARIIGCWKALSKQGAQNDLTDDQNPMKKAVAFCQVIEPQNFKNSNAKTHKVSSKKISGMFQSVVEAYQEAEKENLKTNLICEANHIDGSMNASQKEEKLNWLKAKTEENICRILSNVRCLSEGVDVPSLDAVLFLTPRNSQIDVVQSVGRVMRKAEGKKRGYVVLPIVIPAGVEPHEALNDNKTYKVVWQVLQALRSHDDRFDAFVNKLDLIGKDPSKMEVIMVTDKVAPKLTSKSKNKEENKKLQNRNLARGGNSIGEAINNQSPQTEIEYEFEIGEVERAIYAKVVQKCGNRNHWEEWARDIAKIAKTHIDRIKAILENPQNTREIKSFNNFLDEIRDDLNASISKDEAIEMLAQHLITKPVFDALFDGYSFAKNNPVSKAMEGINDALSEHHIDKEADILQKFYDSVKQRASGINDIKAKQKIIIELYDKFFRGAFPKLVEKLGIVYTPVEVVDFIIHSVNHALKTEFNQTLGSKNVHIIDPFTGTGTFITRLLQSGLISKEELAHKYKNEIHANEIVLLAYYIAAINIESVYHGIMEGGYQPFNGICLTDTFQLYEKEDLVSQILVDNSARRTRQKKLDLRVIIGNPPYSIGQESANDDNQNISYPKLDETITETYAKNSKANLSKGLYDSYIRSIRWASDRIKDAGVIGFVCGSGFIEKSAMDGMRKSLAEEFSNIYVFNLRGDIRKNILSQGKAKEGQNIFGSGSMTGIAITIFVKNPKAKKHGQIYYHDIGDDLKTEEKLTKISELINIDGINQINGWQEITPDKHHDWINQRDESFAQHISLGDKKNKGQAVIFENYSLGVATNRDAWCYNFSKNKLAKNMKEMIRFYNSELDRYKKAKAAGEEIKDINKFVSVDTTKISWTDMVKNDLERGLMHSFCKEHLIESVYRPFTKEWLYYDKSFNQRRYQMPKIFPDASVENKVIHVAGNGARSGFSVLITNNLPDLQHQDNGQCFPLKLFEPKTGFQESQNQEAENLGDLFGNQTSKNPSLFDKKIEENFTVKDGITDAGLKHFQDFYQDVGLKINKEDLFYYIYGILHSEDYRSRFSDNLSKELPRIPRVKKSEDFWKFSESGRKLAALHLNYETVEPYAVNFSCGALGVNMLKDEDFRVEKMKFAKIIKETDKSKIIYNHKITLENIPLEAYEYVVNGKPAIEWVMERQGVSTHKESGIVNDANDFAIETMKNPRYPLDLLLRVITVSLETIKIVSSLPILEI